MSRLFYLVVVLSVGCNVGRAATELRAAKVAAPLPSPSYASAPQSTRSPIDAAIVGGMWPPDQIPAQADQLRAIGLSIDPRELSDPTSGILGAVLTLGGCSASFVSPDGLIATNHHCAERALEYNSSSSNNLLEQGFLAATRADERSSGPAARALLTLAIRDVSTEVRQALSQAHDDLARERAHETIQKELVQRCEQARPNLRCQVVSFYEGMKYSIFERLELRDLRIVYAPPEGIGNFGGEVDNWRWPRHTGDFALFRAYVGKNGQPAAHAAENVPYRPAHWLKLARTPLRPSDVVVVVGSPGRTSRLKTAEEVEDAMTWLYPRRLRLFDEYIDALEALGASDPEAKIRSTSWVRGFNNFRTKNRGELEGMQRADLLARKRAEAEQLRGMIAKTPADQAKYGPVLDAIAAAFAEYQTTREADLELEVEIAMPRLLAAANRIVRLAEERTYPDAERDPEYQERNWLALEDEFAALEKHYHQKVDETLLRLALERALRVPEAQRTAALALIAGQQPTTTSIRGAVSRLYAKTKLANPKLRLQLLRTATPRSLRAHPDPLIQIAVKLRPLFQAAETRRKTLTGKLLALKPSYMEALLKLLGPRTPPDANGTLRLSFGSVQAEPPRDDGKPSRAFTTLSELLGKHQGIVPFSLPEPLLRAARERRFGAYVDPRLQDVPVNFLSDVAISNGNSGSATLNARGELVGLVFDGTYESVASDWVQLPNTRSIHVDIRYVLWLLEDVERATALLRELGGSL